MVTHPEHDQAKKRFTKSEEMYRTILTNVSDAVFLTDDDGSFLFICPNITRILGYTVEEVEAIGNISELIRELAVDAGELHDKGEITNLERVIVDKHGNERSFLVSAKRIDINGAKVLYSCHDITERQQTREALRRSEEKYRRLVENLREEYFFYSHGTDGVFSYLSPSVTSVLGYSPEEFMTCCDAFLTDNPLNQQAARHTEMSIQGIRQPPYQVEIFHKNGSVRILEVAECPIPDENGRIVSVEGIARDVTECRRAEETIRDSLEEAERARDKISAILVSVPNGIIVTDMDGRIVLTNPSAESLLGVAPEDLSDRPVGEFIPQESFLRCLEDTVSGKTPSAPEVDLRDHDSGEMRTYQVGISLVRSREGTATRAVIVLGDVTREREIARMKNEFISTAAHELNTPLTAIMGYLELLIKQAELGNFSAEQQRDFLSIIYKRSESLSGIVDELLHLSQLESGRQIPLDISRFEIQTLIREVVECFANHSSHQFTLELPDEPINIRADRQKISQVLENLLGNAVKYSPDPAPPIRVACSAADGHCLITIEDKGIGMTRKQLEKIFETFYRVDASNTAKSGLGLGTSIAKRYIEAHLGRIWMESEPGRGTKASFAVPVR